MKAFLRTVIVFCIGLELAGAAALYPMFSAAGEEEPL